MRYRPTYLPAEKILNRPRSPYLPMYIVNGVLVVAAIVLGSIAINQ